VSPHARPRMLPLLLVAIVLAGAGCAGKKDTRYRDSIDDPLLTIPAGLDTPVYTGAMEVPPARRAAEPGEVGDIEKPPSLHGAR
jgi:hypothetical protein